MNDNLKSLVEWYIECKETLQKVENFYGIYLPNVRYNTPAYDELQTNYDNAYKQLKIKIKE